MPRWAEKVLLGIIRTGVFAALASPLVVGWNYFFPYIIPRATYFQLLTEIIFAAAILLITFFPEHRPEKSILARAFVLYLIVAALTTLTSADPGKSFIGSIERDFGLWHMLHYGMLFLGLIVGFRTRLWWQMLLGASLAISMYAAGDLIIDVLNTAPTAPFPPSVAGNVTFLAAYLIFHIFFVMWLLTQTRIAAVKGFLILLIVFLSLAVVATGVRGALLGLVVGIGLCFVVLAWKRPRIRVLLIGAVVIGLLAFGMLLANKNSAIFSKSAIVQNITDFSLGPTIHARLAMWKMALAGFQERPLLGWGRENFPLVFNIHFDDSFEALKLGESWEDRAHNIFFDELINAGLLGLAAYIFLLGSAFFLARRRILWIGLLTAYTIQNIFGVDTLNAMLPFTLALAFLHVAATQDPHQTANRISRPMQATAVTAIFALITTGWLFTINPARSNHQMRSALVHLIQGNTSEFQASYEKGQRLVKWFTTFQMEEFGIMLNLLDTVMRQTGRNNSSLPESLIKGFVEITRDLKTSLQSRKHEFRWRLIYGQMLLNQAALTKNLAPLDEAEAIWNDLIATSPRKLFLAQLELTAQIRDYIKNSTSPSPRNP